MIELVETQAGGSAAVVDGNPDQATTLSDVTRQTSEARPGTRFCTVWEPLRGTWTSPILVNYMLRSLGAGEADVLSKTSHDAEGPVRSGRQPRGYLHDRVCPSPRSIRRSGALERLIDVVVASVPLVRSAPVQLLLAGLVQIELGSPVLSRRECRGRNQEIFELVKSTDRGGEYQ